MNTLKASERCRAHREVLARYDLTGKDSGKFRVVQTADGRQTLTGQTVRKEGSGVSGDQAVDEAYAFTGDVYDFYWDVFKRNSLDGNGQKLFSTVHFGNDFNNAFWNGERMVFGDGDGQVFDRFTKCLEVVGHEMTHGVITNTANLAYSGESGALNESIADVMGCLVKQKTLGQNVKEASWIVGEGLFMPSVNGKGVRDLAHPGDAYDDATLGKDPCPATMKDYVKTEQDNGGIHINCTIPSHAFYLASMEIGGHAWEHLGKVWYRTVIKRLHSDADFQTFATTTMQVCRNIFGKGTKEASALNRAWKAVGIL